MTGTVAARSSDMDTGRAASDFYFHRFLCRVFGRPDSPFLLKGGHSVLARTPNARVLRKGFSCHTDQVTDRVRALLVALGGEELSARELMNRLGLSHRPTFRHNYLNPALAASLVERTIPDKPTSRLQKYRARKRP